ncbi:hypothetical protein D3C76_1139660 [compost metagenome]
MHFQSDTLQADRHLLRELALGQALLEAEELAQALELQFGLQHLQAIAHGRYAKLQVFEANSAIEGRSYAAVGDIHHWRQLADRVVHDGSDRPPERQLDDQAYSQNRQQSPLENLRHSDVLEVCASP